MSQDQIKTSTCCAACGAKIPELPEDDALCVRCRYAKTPARLPAIGQDEIEINEAHAPEPALPPEQSLLAALIETGAIFPDVPAAIEAIEQAFDLVGDRRAADALAIIISRFPGGRRGDELRAAFLGGLDDESLSQTAIRHGVTKGTWFKAVNRLRCRLLGKTAYGAGLRERPSCQTRTNHEHTANFPK